MPHYLSDRLATRPRKTGTHRWICSPPERVGPATSAALPHATTRNGPAERQPHRPGHFQHNDHPGCETLRNDVKHGNAPAHDREPPFTFSPLPVRAIARPHVPESGDEITRAPPAFPAARREPSHRFCRPTSGRPYEGRNEIAGASLSPSFDMRIQAPAGSPGARKMQPPQPIQGP